MGIGNRIEGDKSEKNDGDNAARYIQPGNRRYLQNLAPFWLSSDPVGGVMVFAASTFDASVLSATVCLAGVGNVFLMKSIVLA